MYLSPKPGPINSKSFLSCQLQGRPAQLLYFPSPVAGRNPRTLPGSSSPALYPLPPTVEEAFSMESSAFSQPYYTHSRPYRQNHSAPPPPAPLVYSNPEQRWIKTLFVSGLPDDVKPREIHNLFCRRPGFDFCQLEYTGRGDQVAVCCPFSFATVLVILSLLFFVFFISLSSNSCEVCWISSGCF